MLENGAAQIEGTAVQFPQFALLLSVPFESNGKDVTGELRKLHNTELHCVNS
jgi:hypothetical protein